MTLNNHKNHQITTASSAVNHLVANQGVLFVKLHQYHWYVQGPHFFKLHDQFEELYNETSAHFDAFAERLIAKGEKPFSTLSEYLEHAAIEEKPYDEKVSAEEMIQNVINDYHTLEKLTIQGIDLASEENDSGTEDMLIEYKDGIDKTIWMLQAYLGNDAREGLDTADNHKPNARIS